MMKLKMYALLFGLTTLSYAQAASRNLCDDLVDSGTSSAEQIKKCQDKFGVSDYAIEQKDKKKIKEATDESATATDAKKKQNLEYKTFKKDDLFDAGFGKPFYAMRIDYRYRPPREKRITDGDALCSYLGYEKSIKSIVSAEIMPEAADKKGLVVDTNFIGVVSKEPELYKDEDFKFTVRKYVEITCVKRKDKNMEGSADAYKKLTEDLLVLAPEINSQKKDGTTVINNGPRTGKEKSTPNGYNPPDWAKEDGSNSSK
jgi:polyhydroxyalkanoate synthesis regulator phasin